MRKIVFCLQTMTLGGVEKELITVLKQIHDHYDITLLLLHLEDMELLKDIPEDVKIKIIGIDKEYYYGSSIELIKRRIERGKLLEAVAIAIKRCLRIGMATSNTNIEDIPMFDENFDIAIGYHIHSPLLLRYVVEKVRAKKKIAWMHNDFYASGYPIQRLKRFIEKYDEFVAVSKKVEEEFRKLCPWYSGDISTAYNYLDDKEIIQRSQCFIEEGAYLKERRVKLLTVGRFTEQKGIDLAIIVASMLKKENLPFHWFLIGYGKLENFYRQLIQKYDVADCFTILGKKTNPYPYIKNCDIQVQPSRHEAYPLVVMEAKILNKPIVCTDFCGADEQIENGVNGIIVPLNDINALTKELSRLICSKESRDALSKELEKWSPEDALKEIVKHFD